MVPQLFPSQLWVVGVGRRDKTRVKAGVRTVVGTEEARGTGSEPRRQGTQTTVRARDLSRCGSTGLSSSVVTLFDRACVQLGLDKGPAWVHGTTKSLGGSPTNEHQGECPV